VGCVADEIHNPIAGAESPALIYVPRGDSEATISVEDASAESSSTEIALPTPMERFEQITSRPLSEWTTQEFSELLSVSSREVDESPNFFRVLEEGGNIGPVFVPNLQHLRIF